MPRRNKSTEFLNDCVADAMLKLMDVKPLEKISVQEITDLAGVGRATFFRHFSSKREVLTYKLVRLWAQWVQVRGLPEAKKFSLLTTEELFEFNRFHKPLICKIYAANMQNAIYDAFYQIMASQFGDEALHCYANRFYSYGCFGLLDEWVKRGFRETPAQMADIVIHDIVGENVSFR